MRYEKRPRKGLFFCFLTFLSRCGTLRASVSLRFGMDPQLQVDISQFEYQDLLDFANRNIPNPGEFDFYLTFQADYGQSKMIRDIILFLFERNSIEVPWKNRFALISDELVNNSIEYGSMPLDKNGFFIRFRTEGSKLQVTLEVRDTGRGLEAKNSKEMEELRKMKEIQGFDGYL